MREVFVNRERELGRLKSNFERARRGEGRIILIEGPAGIGKTALVEHFISQINDAKILKARATIDTRFKPYHLFTEALKEYGDLMKIKDEQERRKILNLAQDLLVRPRMIFVDEIENGGGYQLYRALRKEIDGIYFSIRMPEEPDGIWLTDTSTDLPKVNPSNLEFEVIPRIYDFLEGKEKKVVYIENINYLIYLNGMDRVVDFLHSLYSSSSGNHVIIVSGWSEYLTEDERSKLFSSFDEIISLEIVRKRKRETVIIVNSIEEVDSDKRVIFSSRKDVGDYTIGESPLNPHRLDFEIFESVAREIENSMDVVLDCIAYLVHYNGIRKIYSWIKAIVDFADKNGTKVYIISKGLSDVYVDILKSITDRSEVMKHTTYEGLQEVNTIKFYDTIFNFLDYNSKRQVILMVLEDIQWADKSSLELLRYLARNISRSRIMIIATYRAESVVDEEETAELVESIQEIEGVYTIRIRGLDREHLNKLLRSIEPSILESDVEAIYEKSEGNPLLAMSLLDYLGRGELEIPDTIRESVEMQLESLDDRTLHFLWILSAIGEYAPVEIVKEVYPKWREKIKKVKGKFIEVCDGTIRFKYSVFREIIYQNASKDVRMFIHRKLGEIYEKKGMIAEAASHYYLAKDLKALSLLKKASRESMENMAFKDALEFCKLALDIAKKYNLTNEICAIYERMGDLHKISGEYRKAVDMYEESLKAGNPHTVSVGIKIGDCYQRMGYYDKALLIFFKYKDKSQGLEKGKIMGKIGTVKWHLGDFEEAKQYLEEYLKYARKYRSAEDEAEAYRNLAIVTYYLSRYDEAYEYARKALDKAIESGKYDLIANSYNVLGVISHSQGKSDDALMYYKKYLEIAEKIGNYDYISKAYNNLAIIYDEKGDFEKAKNYYLLSLELNYKLGNKRDLSISYNNIAVIESENGDSMKAIEYLKKSAKYAEEVGDTYNLCSSYLNLASFYIQLLMFDEARKAINQAMKIARSEGYLAEMVNAYYFLFTIHLENDDLKGAEKALKNAKKYEKNLDDEYIRLTIMDMEMKYYLKSGDLDRAENILEEAYKLADKIHSERDIISLHIFRARIRCARGDKNNAIIYFEKAVQYYKEKNKKKLLADAYEQYADCLSNFDRDEARKYYSYAHTLYREINNIRRAERVKSKMREMEGG